MNRCITAFFAVCVLGAVSLFAEPSPSPKGALPATAEIPVTRIALFSSGVGYFEHSGAVDGAVRIDLPFRSSEVRDALKSLTVRDAASSPSVHYPLRADTERALKAFRVDLSGNPQTSELLSRLRGASVQVVTGSRTLEGRIVGVESRPVGEKDGLRAFLSLECADGLHAVKLDEVDSFRLTDAALAAEFDRALSLLDELRDRDHAVLELDLMGKGTREISFGYVSEAPVWKASYRLDLSGKQPWLQGWAIVDNDSGRDWKGVTLSLISGRPVSFVQELYAPYYLERPEVPLAIAGTAAPRTWEGGVTSEKDEELFAAPAPAAMASEEMEMDRFAGSAKSKPLTRSKKAEAPAMAESRFDVAQARSAGDQFEFTLPAPVDLERGRSALLPLVASGLSAERVSIYSGGSALLGARIENSTGMKLPAGPVTVFDGGVYAGDALLDFLNEKDTRLISFGEDLALHAEESASESEESMTVSIAKGVLTIVRQRLYTKSYQFRNGAGRDKSIIVEHPETSGASLVSPLAFLEKAPGLYRFRLSISAGKEGSLEVVERRPQSETIAILGLSSDAFLRYTTQKAIKQSVRDALAKAADLRRKVEDANRQQKDAQTRKAELAADQGRIRDNLASMGRDSAEGRKYLNRLLDTEAEIDKLTGKIDEQKKVALEAQKNLEAYISGLNLE